MSKNEKKRQESKRNLKRLKNKLNKMDEARGVSKQSQSCLSVIISKLFRKTN